MGTVSVSVEDEMKARMSQLPEVNWSAVARKAFEEKLKEINLLKKLAGKSKLTVKDAEEISKKMSENMAKKFRSMYLYGSSIYCSMPRIPMAVLTTSDA